jgi:hypothetical protein
LKKLIAMIFLLIHLFNIGGQLAFHQYLAYKADQFFNAQVNKNLYNVDDLTEVKIPVNMPQITDCKRYANLNGEVRFKNASYNYVKIRVTKKAIYLMCIPNYETTHLCGRNIICAKQIKDISIPHKDHVPFGKINIMDYNYPVFNYKFSAPLFALQKEMQTGHSHILETSISGPGQPPDMMALVS